MIHIHYQITRSNSDENRLEYSLQQYSFGYILEIIAESVETPGLAPGSIVK